MDAHSTINNVPILLIILKENYRARSCDCRNTDMKISCLESIVILGKNIYALREE